MSIQLVKSRRNDEGEPDTYIRVNFDGQFKEFFEVGPGGAMLLTPEAVQKIAEHTGLAPESVETFIQQPFAKEWKEKGYMAPLAAVESARWDGGNNGISFNTKGIPFEPDQQWDAFIEVVAVVDNRHLDPIEEMKNARISFPGWG